MDRQLLHKKVCQIISVRKTNSGVFVLFKTKSELKCQNELFLYHHFLETQSVITFDVIMDSPFLFFEGGQKKHSNWSKIFFGKIRKFSFSLSKNKNKQVMSLFTSQITSLIFVTE